MRCNYKLQHMTLRVTVESAGASLRPSYQSMQRDRWLERGCPLLIVCVPVCLGARVLTALSNTLDTECTLAIWA